VRDALHGAVALGVHTQREAVRDVHKHGADALRVASHDAHAARDNRRYYQYE
jgi:hypothetical protein